MRITLERNQLGTGYGGWFRSTGCGGRTGAVPIALASISRCRSSRSSSGVEAGSNASRIPAVRDGYVLQKKGTTSRRHTGGSSLLPWRPGRSWRVSRAHRSRRAAPLGTADVALLARTAQPNGWAVLSTGTFYRRRWRRVPGRSMRERPHRPWSLSRRAREPGQPPLVSGEHRLPGRPTQVQDSHGSRYARMAGPHLTQRGGHSDRPLTYSTAGRDGCSASAGARPARAGARATRRRSGWQPRRAARAGTARPRAGGGRSDRSRG